MRIIKQSFSFVESVPISGSLVLYQLERIGRTCYKSENRITDDSARFFVAKLIKAGHTSVLEHVSVTVRIITNRGVSHELVRHRIASYSQESTRWCDYGKEGSITVILPVWLSFGKDTDSEASLAWEHAMKNAEVAYFTLRRLGWGAEKARGVLPNDLKTEIVMTANLREWRLIFGQRCAKNAHPQMRLLMQEILLNFRDRFPVIFDDLDYEGQIICEP